MSHYSSIDSHHYNGGLILNESELQYWAAYKTVANFTLPLHVDPEPLSDASVSG